LDSHEVLGLSTATDPTPTRREGSKTVLEIVHSMLLDPAIESGSGLDLGSDAGRPVEVWQIYTRPLTPITSASSTEHGFAAPRGTCSEGGDSIDFI
jgi:hypothetical protein